MGCQKAKRMQMKRYSQAFERDFKWYLAIRHDFSFDGRLPIKIVYDKNGISGKEAFFLYDSQGKLCPTRHPLLLASLIRTKGSVNLHIKMYAEDRANGCLPSILFKELCTAYNVPEWFIMAVEQQKIKYYDCK